MNRLFSLLFIFFFGFSTASLSHDEHTHEGVPEITVQRSQLMDSLALSMKQLGSLDFSSSDFSIQLRYTSETLLSASEAMEFMFPSGSNAPPSEALDTIWEDPEDFQSKIDEFTLAAQSLWDNIDSIGSKSDLQSHMTQLGKSCGSCHRTYRKKKN